MAAAGSALALVKPPKTAWAGLAVVALMSGRMPVAQATPPPPVQSALAALAQGGTELAAGWRYRETISGSNGKARLVYDPERKPGERWTVVKVNGETPDKEARKRWADRAAARAKASGNGPGIGSGWLAASDYKLIKTTPDKLVYQLRPHAGEGADEATAELLGHLAGKFVVARDDYRPLSLRLDNFESFSPRFGVTVEAFGFRTKFKRLGRSGPVVVAQTSNFARGTIFWIKGFEDKTEVVLSDFSRVGSFAPAAETGG